jgi:hypothetical protein
VPRQDTIGGLRADGVNQRTHQHEAAEAAQTDEPAGGRGDEVHAVNYLTPK